MSTSWCSARSSFVMFLSVNYPGYTQTNQPKLQKNNNNSHIQRCYCQPTFIQVSLIFPKKKTLNE